MRKILTLSLTILALQLSALEMELKPAQKHRHLAESRIDVELDLFGVSYHTNRDYDFNESNYGVGVNLALSSPGYDHMYMVVSTGTYKDSYDEDAFFFMVGPRALIGYRNGFHATVGLQAGYLEGSGAKGIGAFPVLSVGYDWFDVCFTGQPVENDTGSAEDSRMFALFLKFRLFDF